MNLARARELGISRRVEPALRGVTHVCTPRTARRRRSRRASLDDASAGACSQVPPLPALDGEASCAASSSSGSGDDADVPDCDAEDAAPPAELGQGVTSELAVGADADAAAAAQAAPPESAAPAAAGRAARGAVAPVTSPPAPPAEHIAALDLANWMRQLAGVLWETPLHKIRMPGTHDSGAYALSRRHMAPSKLPRWLLRINRRAWWLTRPFSGLVARWGEAQRLDVAGQLAAGARYLDLRIVNVKGAFHVAHGMLGADVRVVLQQVSTFLEEHPGEVVVADCNHFHHFSGRADHVAFIAVLSAALGPHLARREVRAADSSVTLGTLVAANTRCVLLYGGCDFMGVAAAAAAANCWPRTLREIVSPWPRAASWHELAARLGALDAAGAQAPGFFVLQGVVTPNARLIRRGLLRRPSSLRQLAATVTPEVVRLVACGALSARCIVLLDHIDVADVAHMLAAAYAPHLLAQAPPLAGTAAEVDEDVLSLAGSEPEDVLDALDDEEAGTGGAWMDGAECWAEAAEGPLLAQLSLLLRESHFDEPAAPADGAAAGSS